MAADSKIEWTDHTFNPWIGCTKVSPACDHCYAERSTPSRTLGVTWGAGQPRRRTAPANWALPLRWNAQAEAFAAQHGRRQRVFCASLADWLDKEADTEWLVDLLDLVRRTPNVDWLLLSKRIGTWRARLKLALSWIWTNARERLSDLLNWVGGWLDGKPPANVWIGATICNQPEAHRDIRKLLAVPARVRFLSMEPLLGPVDLTEIPISGHGHHEFDPIITANVLARAEQYPPLPSVHWVIVGGESGPNARPMHPDWACSLRDQCQVAGVPFLFKQWGEWVPADDDIEGGIVPVSEICGDIPYTEGKRVRTQWLSPNGGIVGHSFARVGKKAAGRQLDGRTWDEVPT